MILHVALKMTIAHIPAYESAVERMIHDLSLTVSTDDAQVRMQHGGTEAGFSRLRPLR